MAARLLAVQILLANGGIFTPVVGIVLTSDRNILASGLDKFSPMAEYFVPGLAKVSLSCVYVIIL